MGTGTITIRATNSVNTADWTVDYATVAAPDEGDEVSVTVPLTEISVFDDYIRWSDDQSLGSTFAANGADQVLSLVDLNNANPAGRVRISITGLNNDFTPEFEANGRIIFEASDGETLEVMIADADMTEIYQWTPTNSAEVVAFVLHVKDLVDQDATFTLQGEGASVVNVAPSFTDSTGDDQDWVQDEAITSVTVPVASGTPTPTYAVVGSLPTGISFNANTRVISGTPTVIGSRHYNYQS